MQDTKHIPILFFGSSNDSVAILTALVENNYTIAATVTQPPRPVGRKQILTPSPVHQWSQAHNISSVHFPTQKDKPTLYEDEQTVIDTLQPFKAGLIISSSYGQLIPWSVIQEAEYGGINVHPSLLPRFRGADPIPWTIIAGDNQTGVTIVSLSKAFDEGKILAQKKIPLTITRVHEELRRELFLLGAQLLIETLPSYIQHDVDGEAQKKEHATYARRLTREDGYIPWSIIKNIMANKQITIDELQQILPVNYLMQKMDEHQIKEHFSHGQVLLDRLFRALTPWPGLWTNISYQGRDMRMKLLDLALQHEQIVIKTVQLEGKNPVPFTDISARI